MTGLPEFDIIESFPIDYMHNVLLGVVKLLLGLWIESKNHRHEYYIGLPQKILTINKNIQNIRPSRSFSRKPRPINEYVHWKANELRNWLLYYGVPCLYGVLPNKHLNHVSLLSEAIFILLKTSITPADIKKASRNLKKICQKYTEKTKWFTTLIYSHT